MFESVERILRRIHHQLRRHSRTFARQFGLTDPQLMLLRKIWREGHGISIGELAAGSNRSLATTTGILDRLERRGLIAKHRSETDRRKVLVLLTPAGNRLLQSRPELRSHQLAEALKAVPKQEQQRILGALQRLEGLILEADPDPALPEGLHPKGRPRRSAGDRP